MLLDDLRSNGNPSRTTVLKAISDIKDCKSTTEGNLVAELNTLVQMSGKNGIISN